MNYCLRERGIANIADDGWTVALYMALQVRSAGELDISWANLAAIASRFVNDQMRC